MQTAWLKRYPVMARILFYGLSVLCAVGVWKYRYPLVHMAQTGTLPEMRTVVEVVDQHQPRVDAHFAPLARQAGLSWPLRHMTWIGLKEEMRLEVWGSDDSVNWLHLTTYPVKGASGTIGPKSREGDLQVPEGVYALTTLNPQSSCHLSVRVDYPNATDRERLANSNVPMGSDIYVHGSLVSVGCLAMGDATIEELFVLAAMVDEGNRRIVIAPWDLRVRASPPTQNHATAVLYRGLAKELDKFVASSI